jgi:hypothetical protein
VADVQEGSEGELRHLLESIVLQVNSEFHAKDDEAAPEPEQDPGEVSDNRVAATFRSYADPDA